MKHEEKQQYYGKVYALNLIYLFTIFFHSFSFWMKKQENGVGTKLVAKMQQYTYYT